MTFKKATVIVICLHVLGGVLLYGVLKYKSHRAREVREARDREIAASYSNNPADWNNQGKKPRVVAIPKLKPKVRKEEKSLKDYFVNSVVYVINKSEELYKRLLTIPPVIDYQTKDTLDKIEKKINKPVQTKPIIRLKPKSIPSPTPQVTIIYKYTQVVEQNVVTKKPEIVSQETSSIYIPSHSSSPPLPQLSHPRLRPVRLCPPPNFD